MMMLNRIKNTTNTDTQHAELTHNTTIYMGKGWKSYTIQLEKESVVSYFLVSSFTFSLWYFVTQEEDRQFFLTDENVFW